MTAVTQADDAVLLIGCGYVGRRFLARQQPGNVIALSRSPLAPPLQASIVDLDTDESLPVTLHDRYTVLYTVPPGGGSLRDLRLERLLALLEPAPQRFVYISTTGVYGNRDGALVDEVTPVRPETQRAERRVAAERQLRSWGDTSGCDIVILRVPGIYGPGRLGTERLREGLPVIQDADAGPGNRIHVDDLVICCEAALSPGTPPGVYNVGDGDYRTSTWFANDVARQSNLPAPPEISMAEAERQFSPMRMSFLRESRRVDTTKMRDVLDVTPRYSNPEDGIAASLAEEPS